MKKRFMILTILALSMFIGCSRKNVINDPVVSVQATVETDPVPSPSEDDALDDLCIWIHPTDPSLSTVIGSHNAGPIGLLVYDLEGNELSRVEDGGINNVDIRYNFPLAGDSVALVTGGNVTENTISIYKVNVETRALENVAARKLPIGLDVGVYGSCMYYSVKTGKYYAIINEKTGKIEQWELFDNGEGKVDGKLVRTLYADSKTEGCVADDILAKLYVGEENVAILQFEAEPDAGVEQTVVALTKFHFPGDLEGLSMYYTDRETGYLIGSSQENSTYVVYTREAPYSYVGTFQIIDGETIDGAQDTDGVDVTNFGLGSAFPNGMFVCQDGNNRGASQNFKLVPWESVAKSFSPELKFETTWDPRILE